MPTPTPNQIDQAADLLRAGRLVGMPTETVYGLAADATNHHAVAAIFAAKGRPAINPLISHVAGIEAARQLAAFSPTAEALAALFWPGGLTLVLPRASQCPVAALACAGLDTIAVRVPDHPVAQALLRAVSVPLAAPSANRSGRPSPTLAHHVVDDLGEAVAMVLDAGPCGVGLESTVVAVDDDRVTLLREGAISVAMLEHAVGAVARVDATNDTAPRSPGQLLRHYAPNAPVRINATSTVIGGVLLGFGDIQAVGPTGVIDPAWSLSLSGDINEAAANLFALMRAADALSVTEIAVAPIPSTGIGAAINDRLARAVAAQA